MKCENRTYTATLGEMYFSLIVKMTLDKSMFSPAFFSINMTPHRMSTVLLECLDFREVISKYDGKDTLFMIDAPYLHKEKYYFGGFSKSDHVDLARMLHQIQWKCIVIYYSDPFILNLYVDFMFEW